MGNTFPGNRDLKTNAAPKIQSTLLYSATATLTFPQNCKQISDAICLNVQKRICGELFKYGTGYRATLVLT